MSVSVSVSVSVSANVSVSVSGVPDALYRSVVPSYLLVELDAEPRSHVVHKVHGPDKPDYALNGVRSSAR